MIFEYFAQTDPGLIRENNEDSVALDPENQVLVLADGMGGYNAGEVASAMATTFIKAELGRWLAEGGELGGCGPLEVGLVGHGCGGCHRAGRDGPGVLRLNTGARRHRGAVGGLQRTDRLARQGQDLHAAFDGAVGEHDRIRPEGFLEGTERLAGGGGKVAFDVHGDSPGGRNRPLLDVDYRHVRSSAWGGIKRLSPAYSADCSISPARPPWR